MDAAVEQDQRGSARHPVKAPPTMHYHAKAEGSSAALVRRALGTIPYRGPVLSPKFLGVAEADRAGERARD
jgi:hypothetical protein